MKSEESWKSKWEQTSFVSMELFDNLLGGIFNNHPASWLSWHIFLCVDSNHFFGAAGGICYLPQKKMNDTQTAIFTKTVKRFPPNSLRDQRNGEMPLFTQWRRCKTDGKLHGEETMNGPFWCPGCPGSDAQKMVQNGLRMTLHRVNHSQTFWTLPTQASPNPVSVIWSSCVGINLWVSFASCPDEHTSFLSMQPLQGE